jgi:WD40 repeat protein
VKTALVLFLWLTSTGAVWGQTLEPLASLEAPGSLRFATVCRGGRSIAGVVGDHDLYIWSLPSHKQRAVHVFDGHIDLLTCGEKALAAGFRHGTVLVFDAAGSERQRIEMKDELAAMAFLPDEEHLVVATFQSPLQVRDIASGKHLWTGTTDFGNTAAIAIAPTGKLIIAADGDTHIRGYDESGKLLYSADSGLLEPFDLSLSADGKRFAVAGAEGTIELYDSASGQRLKKSERSGNPILAVAMSPQGTKVMALEVDARSMEQAAIGYWDVTRATVNRLPVKPETVLGFGKGDAALLLVRQEAPGKISVERLE